MKKLTTIIESFVKESGMEELTSAEIQSFLEKYGRRLSDQAKQAIELTLAIGIFNREPLDDLLTGGTSGVKRVAAVFQADEKSVKDLKSLLSKLSKKNELVTLPQYIGKEDVLKTIDGGLSIEDVTLDFKTERGKTEIVKKYSKFLDAKVREWDRKFDHAMPETELTSIAYSALAWAINSYKSEEKIISLYDLIVGKKNNVEATPEVDKEIDSADKELNKERKTASFTTFLSQTIDNAMRIEFTQFKSIVRGNNGEDSFDQHFDTVFGDEDSGQTDHYKYLGQQAEVDTIDDVKNSEAYKLLFKKLAKTFKERDLIILMKHFGIGGSAPMTFEEIGKEMGISTTRANEVVKNMLNAIRNDRTMRPYLDALKDDFLESVCVNLYNKGRDVIVEELIKNDTWVFFTEAYRPNVVAERASKILYEHFSDEDIEWFGKLFEGEIDLQDEYYYNSNKCRAFLNYYDIFENYNNISDNLVYLNMCKVVDDIQNDTI